MYRSLKNGFTLVEVLIVTGIIGLLMALLVPALGRARDHSNLVVCRTRLRALAMGCMVYATDNDSMLPVDKQLHNPHTGLIESLSDGAYVQEPRAYYCPSETTEELEYSEENFNKGNIGYFYYSFSGRPTDRYLSSFFLKQLPWPRLLRDITKANKWVFSDSWFSNMPTAHRWYKKGVNYVILDGSVHMVEKSPRREFK